MPNLHPCQKHFLLFIGNTPLKWLVTMNYILFAAHTLPDTRVSADRVCWWKGLQDVASVLKARVKVVCREFPDALGLTTLGGFTGQRSWALRAIWEQRTVSGTPTHALRPCASSTHELKPNISRATHYTPSWHEWTPNTWMFSSFLSFLVVIFSVFQSLLDWFR